MENRILLKCLKYLYVIDIKIVKNNFIVLFHYKITFKAIFFTNYIFRIQQMHRVDVEPLTTKPSINFAR